MYFSYTFTPLLFLKIVNFRVLLLILYLLANPLKGTSAPLPQKKLPVIVVSDNQAHIKFKLLDSVTIVADLQQQLNSTDTLPVKAAVNKKIAAILAFPLFGIVGLHRIYLGTKLYIPIVYIVTVGGCFGILPLVDFFILLSRTPEQLEKYQNNSRVFMWIDR